MSLALVNSILAADNTVSVPFSTDSVVVMVALPASTSLIDSPVSERLVSSATLCAPGTELTGASFAAVTVIVKVLGVGSRSTPPLPVLPLSRTWNVKLL